LSYRNDLAKWCEDNGYIGIMSEGWEKYLGWRSPNYLYNPPGCNKIKVLLKNYKLSDDIAFRFGNKEWANYPLSADTYADWIHAHHGDGQTVNLFMDYESFGEHQWEETGIFEFLKVLPEMVMRHPDTSFKTATETVEAYDAAGVYDVPDILTWADTDRDLTAWIGNDIQRDAIAATYKMEEAVMKTRKRDIIENWRKLQTSDHFYYMCTKWSEDGDVHAYFSPYQSPYDAYIAFMNALSDLQLRVSYAVAEREQQELEKQESEPVPEETQKDYPDVTNTPDENETHEVPETPEPEPEQKPGRAGWWGKLINKIPFFKRPRPQRTSS
jgi:alpha-amylase